MQKVGTAVQNFAVIFEYIFYCVDYKGTEHLRFEDDEYYYYVKAMPKMIVRPMLDDIDDDLEEDENKEGEG